MPGSTKYGRPVKRRSITFRADQFDFLAELKNSSEWVRDAVDDKLAWDTAASPILRVRALQRILVRTTDGAEIEREIERLQDLIISGQWR